VLYDEHKIDEIKRHCIVKILIPIHLSQFIVLSGELKILKIMKVMECTIVFVMECTSSFYTC